MWKLTSLLSPPQLPPTAPPLTEVLGRACACGPVPLLYSTCPDITGGIPSALSALNDLRNLNLAFNKVGLLARRGPWL